MGSTVVSSRPGGTDPVTVHDPTFIVLVIVKPIVVIVTPTVALKAGNGPVGFGVSELARIVAPAIESMAPREAATAAADLRSVPMGDAATNSSATAATRRTGVRCRSATSVAVDMLIQPKRLWAPIWRAKRPRMSVEFMCLMRRKCQRRHRRALGRAGMSRRGEGAGRPRAAAPPPARAELS